jgi:transcription-repair coupling factor (superfamily II helicase)
MKRFLLFIILFIINLALMAQNTNTEAKQIKQQMATIRKSTNWSNPAAAKEANAKLEALAAKLTQSLRQNNPAQQTTQVNNQSQPGSKVEIELQQKMDAYSTKLSNQMLKIAREGDGGKMDLAEPLRDEIVKEYKDDDDPKIKCREWMQSMPYLLINMSEPQVQVVIDQMTVFRGIKTLIVTCNTKGTPVDLEEILRNAVGYPLEELYIINFGNSVTHLPSGIGNFSKLNMLSVYNNNLLDLPASISKLNNLNELYADINPIMSIKPVVSTLSGLRNLGIAKTGISEAEITQIQQILPKCTILK